MKILLKDKNKTSVYSVSGRSIVCTSGTVYDLSEADARILLNTGDFEVWRKPVAKPVSAAVKRDRKQISMEPHEQRYMRDKIKGFTKKELIRLYNETQKALDFNMSEEGYWSDNVKKDKKEIIKIIAEEFAKINSRKKVNNLIREVK